MGVKKSNNLFTKEIDRMFIEGEEKLNSYIYREVGNNV